MLKKIFLLILLFWNTCEAQIDEPNIEVVDIEENDSLDTVEFLHLPYLLYLDICSNIKTDSLKKTFLFCYFKFKVNKEGKIKKIVFSQNMSISLTSIINKYLFFLDDRRTLKRHIKYKILPIRKFIVIPIISICKFEDIENVLGKELPYLIPNSKKQFILKPIIFD